jgi:hypothetical protein
MKAKTTFTEEQKRLYNLAYEEYWALKEPEPILPNPDEMQRAADRWLAGIMDGKPVPLDLPTKWALGADEEEGGIAARPVTAHIAKAFVIKTYDDIVMFTPLDEDEE